MLSLSLLMEIGDTRLDMVFDETGDHYVLMQVGWDGGRRVRVSLIYATLHFQAQS
jgi:hypothetical protein